jgi:hypothetical protein
VTGRPQVRFAGRPAPLAAGLVLLVAIIYAPVRHFGFVNYDDPENISANAHLAGGFTPGNFRHAMTDFVAGHWVPLTRCSFLLDARLFGLRPGPMHVENVALHAAGALLLFGLLADATGAVFRPAVVAALFAVHPMHVESVAWLTERRDVLSTPLLLASMWAYLRHTRGGRWWYAASLALCAMSLTAKAMGVTLPVLLVLLDFWPLCRRRWMDKIPFLVLAGGAALMAWLAQRSEGAAAGLSALSLAQRLDNAAVCAVIYVIKLAVPTGLAVFYPHPGDWPSAQVAASLVALVGMSVAAVRTRAGRPWIAMGWAWFLVALLPVSGIGQSGAQAMADRYSYLPSVGLFIAVVWETARWIRGRPLRVVAACGAIAAMALTATRQVRFWSDTTALFEHADAVTTGNWTAHLALGELALERGDLPAAVRENQAVLRIRPDNAKALNNLGNCWFRADTGRAIDYYTRAVASDPKSAAFRTNLAAALHRDGRDAEAVGQLKAALTIDPSYGPARAGLADLGVTR